MSSSSLGILSSTSLVDSIYFLLVLLICMTSCSSSRCPFFECSPDIASLDHSSINSTLSIRCAFLKRIDDPANIMWRFHFGKSDRIINSDDGHTLEPFRHEIIQYNNSNYAKTMSILHIPLRNSSYYTNYTLMNVGDMCQLTVRVHLQETALSLTNSGSNSAVVRASSQLAAVFVSTFFVLLVTEKWLLAHR